MRMERKARQETAGGSSVSQPVGCLTGWAASEMVSGPTVQLLMFITILVEVVGVENTLPRDFTREEREQKNI